MISGLSPKPNESAIFGASSNSGTHCPIFQTIPPERIGLNGEYDHSGLAKRVIAALGQEFSDQLNNLRITQRGKVVIFIGKLPSQHLLKRMVHVAMQENGAADVETHGVSIVDACRRSSGDRRSLNRRYYAC